jgi:hypothetical protein
MDYVTRQFINLTKKLRKDFNRALLSLQRSIEKISSGVDSAAADYHAEQERSANERPVILGELRRPQSEIDQEETRESHKEARAARQEGRDRVRLWFESIGLLIAGVLAIANIGLWLVTKEVARSSQEAASAANSQVQASKTSIEATVKQFELDQRAWIGESTQLVDRVDAHSIAAQIEFTNSGKTPARNISKSISVHMAPAPLIKRPPTDSIKQLQFFGHLSLAPQAKLTMNVFNMDKSVMAKLSAAMAQEYDRITAGLEIVYIFGELRYDDVYSRPHSTQYCTYLAKVQDNPIAWKLFFCDEFNDMN